MFSWIKKPLLALMLLASSLAWDQTVAFYTDRALGVNPFSPGAGATPGPVFLAFAQVRVCTLPLTIGTPCPNPAPITDIFGNPISIVGGNFGQLTTDVVGRFSFGCTTGLYQVQVAATGSNTPALAYPITCPNGQFSGVGSIILANAQPGATPDVQITNAITAALPGQEIWYQCAAGSTLPAFASTVTINKRIILKLGGCTFPGPSSGYMFDVTTVAPGVHINGLGYSTILMSNSNTDVIHFDAGVQSWWQVTDLQVTDGLSAAARTSGAAVFADSSGLNAEEGVKVDNLIVTQMNKCIYIKFPVNAVVSNTTCITNTGNGITFQGPGSTAYAINDVVFHVGTAAGSTGSIGFVFDQVSASGIWGGQSSSKAGTGVQVTGSALNQSQGFTISDFDAETDASPSGGYDGIDMFDVSGFTITGGDSSSQTGSGIHCEGGGGGVISAINVGNNTRYGVDLSGTSPLGNACAGVTINNISWNGAGNNLLGNTNDPNNILVGETLQQTGNHFSAPTWRVPPHTFSALVACAAGLEGTTAAVSDSTTAVWGATITGTGTNHVLAYCDGTNWTVTAK